MLFAAWAGSVSVGARAQDAVSAAPASFVVVHGIPGRDVAATLDPLLPVDVQIDGKYCLLQGFTFGSIAGPFDVPAGTYTVKVSLANPIDPCGNSGQAVISASVTLKAGEFGAVVAALSTAGAPAADVFGINVAAIAQGSQRLMVAHAADAPAVRVTVTSNGSGAIDARGFPLAPGDEHSVGIATNTSLSLSAQAGSAVIGPVHVSAGNQSVVLGFAVGSAKSGSATLLTKVIPAVF
jgi:hypothetical protein